MGLGGARTWKRVTKEHGFFQSLFNRLQNSLHAIQKMVAGHFFSIHQKPDDENKGNQFKSKCKTRWFLKVN